MQRHHPFSERLYAALLLSLLRALVQPEITAAHLIPIVVLLPLCGLGDKTILLAARVEHHFAMIVCFLFAGNWIAACKWVQLAIWFCIWPVGCFT